MYNAKQKETFMSTIPNKNTYKSYRTIFNSIEEVETALQKDISEMSLDEILVALDASTGTKCYSIRSHYSMLSKYTDWCIKNGKTTLVENNFTKVTSSTVDKSQSFKQSYVSGEDELNEVISKSLYTEQAFNDEAQDNIKELIIRLSYEGMEEAEIRKLKKEHIDFENNIIKSPVYDNIIYKMPDYVISLTKKCLEITEIGCVRRDVPSVLKLCINDYVFRPRVSKNRPLDYDGGVSQNFIWKKIVDTTERYEENTGIYKRFTCKTLAESKNFSDYFSSNENKEFLDALKVDIKMRNPEKSDMQLYSNINSFENDYIMWKKAFH